MNMTMTVTSVLVGLLLIANGAAAYIEEGTQVCDTSTNGNGYYETCTGHRDGCAGQWYEYGYVNQNGTEEPAGSSSTTVCL